MPHHSTLYSFSSLIIYKLYNKKTQTITFTQIYFITYLDLKTTVQQRDEASHEELDP
jgi:hypothetical protein